MSKDQLPNELTEELLGEGYTLVAVDETEDTVYPTYQKNQRDSGGQTVASLFFDKVPRDSNEEMRDDSE